MPTMTISLDGVALKDIALSQPRTTLGRRPYNDIVVDNLAVSGEHAVFVQKPEGLELTDLNSTNGTYVNGQPVKKHVLHHNDVIELGKYRLKYIVDATQPGLSASEMIDTAAIKPFELPPTGTDVGARPAGEGGGDTQVVAAGALERAEKALAAAGERLGIIQVLSGANAGRELELTKSLTTLGKPGVQVAVIARRPHGYFITHVEGSQFPVVNGTTLDAQAHPLADHDVIEIAGVKMEFFLKT